MQVRLHAVPHFLGEELANILPEPMFIKEKAMGNTKDKNKESIQQQPAKGDVKGIKTPEPPQKKDPAKKAVSDEDLKNKPSKSEDKE